MLAKVKNADWQDWYIFNLRMSYLLTITQAIQDFTMSLLRPFSDAIFHFFEGVYHIQNLMKIM